MRIDGSWEPSDFVQALQSVESIYYKMILGEHGSLRRRGFDIDSYTYFQRERLGDASFQSFLDHTNQRILSRARYEASESERIFVRRISYASPGGIDLLGIGKVVEVIANSIQNIVEHFDTRTVRRERDAQASLETEIKRIEVEKERENLRSLKIRNAKEALEVISRFHSDDNTLIQLLVRDQDLISELIADGKLIGAGVSSRDAEEHG